MDDFISREALLKKLLMPEKGTMEFSADVLDAIMEAPAVDARPVRHSCAVKIYDNPYTGKLYTTCLRCAQKISPKDAWCKHCGALLDLEVTPE